MSLPSLSPRAIVVDLERDNVALAVGDVAPGRYALGSGALDVAEPVTPGQRIALRDIPAGSFLIQYGCPFAISRGISRGHRADPDRIEPGIPKVDPASIDLAEVSASETLPGDETLPTSFAGYRRPNGLVGTRARGVDADPHVDRNPSAHSIDRVAALAEDVGVRVEALLHHLVPVRLAQSQD